MRYRKRAWRDVSRWNWVTQFCAVERWQDLDAGEGITEIQAHQRADASIKMHKAQIDAEQRDRAAQWEEV